MTDEEFEKKLDRILERCQSPDHDWMYWSKNIDPFVVAKSICILARAVNGGEP